MIYPWLKDDWEQLAQMRLQQRLPHALMFVGPDESGIEAFAEELAKAVLCENEGAVACGACSNCHLFAAGNHPDYFHLQPGDSSSIKVDSLRVVCRSLTQKPARGGYQVVFIERADTMQIAGSNALLKTLEEPEGDVLFILWARRHDALPATIHSRTQRFSLGVNGQEQMQQWLNKELDLPSGKPWLKAAGNRPLAVKALQADDYFATRDELVDCLLSVRSKHKSALAAAEAFADWDRSTYFRALLSIAADGLRSCLGIDAAHWVNDDKRESIDRLFQSLHPEQMQAFYDCVRRIWQLEQLPQALNKSLLDCQVWLEWEKIAEESYVN